MRRTALALALALTSSAAIAAPAGKDTPPPADSHPGLRVIAQAISPADPADCAPRRRRG